MSLLLEALKKAERAKEEARRQAEAGDEGAAGSSGKVPAADKHVVTRDELPDISQPLEIASEDLAQRASAGHRPAEPAPTPLGLVTEPPPRRPPPAEPRPPVDGPQKAAAKNVFEAKFKEPNPRLPFFITMGVLGAVAIGTIIYFWLQLRPPAPLVNPNPVRPAYEKPVDPATLPRSPAAQAVEPPGAAAAVQIPGLPAGVPQPPAAAKSAPVPAPPTAAAAPATSSPPATVKPSPREPLAQAREPQAQARPPRAAPADAPRTRERAPAPAPRVAPAVHPRLQQAYTAFVGGDFAAARAAYLDALRDEPDNRDALLGMAAVEMRAGRLEAADGYYVRILRSDPRDADAHAGRIALRGEQVDPVQTESRLKNLLAAEPDAHVLYFTLGNQFAQQARWAEAQQSYFRAFSADAENPDYAYNLAVSLDQLRQTRQALDYYRRAISLAQTRTANFDQALARSRVQALTQAVR